MGPLRAIAGCIAIVAGVAGLLDAQPVLADGLNPFILTNLVSRHIVIEIDWIAGRPPAPMAVRAVEELLGRHCPEGKRVDVRVDDEIDLQHWNAVRDRPGLERLVARFLDHDPSDWRETEVVYVLYVPDNPVWSGRNPSGLTDWIVFDHAGETRVVRTVLLFTGQIRRNAWLWITPPKVERVILVHELGHVLGLVSNPLHTQPSHPDHCTRSRCVMNQPGPRALFVNALPALFAGQLPRRFGRRCLADIRAAKTLWAADELRTTDLADRLRAERAAREAEIFAGWRAERELP